MATNPTEFCKVDCFNCPFSDCRSDHYATRKETALTRAGFYTPKPDPEALSVFHKRLTLTKKELANIRKAAEADGAIFPKNERQKIEARKARAAKAAKVRTEEEERERLARIRKRKAEEYHRYYLRHREEVLAKQREAYHRKKKEKETCATTTTP